MKKLSELTFPGLNNIVQLLQVHAEISSQKMISHITCQQLNHTAKQLAAILQEIARPEQKMVLFYDHYSDALPIFFASWYAGLTAVPVDFLTTVQHPNYLPHLMAVAKPALFVTTRELYSKAKNSLHQSADFQNAWHIVSDEIIATPAKWHDPDITDTSIALLEYHFNAGDQSTHLAETTHYALLHDTLPMTEVCLHKQLHLPLVTELLKAVHQCKQLKKGIVIEDEENPVLKYAI